MKHDIDKISPRLTTEYSAVRRLSVFFELTPLTIIQHIPSSPAWYFLKLFWMIRTNPLQMTQTQMMVSLDSKSASAARLASKLVFFNYTRGHPSFTSGPVGCAGPLSASYRIGLSAGGLFEPIPTSSQNSRSIFSRF